MICLVPLNRLSFEASLTISGVRPKNYPLFLKNNPSDYNMKNKSSLSVAPISCAQDVVTHHLKVDVKDEEKYVKAGLEGGESMVPNHVAMSLDGNRRWLKAHGRDLDYRPFFNSQMRFAEYCLKWGVGTATSYIYGLGNLKHRTKEATDLLFQQFKTFLEEGLENFTRKGVKVTVVGEKQMIPESCQEIIKQVEEATKDNTNLDLMLPMCYTSQRDIIDATKKICKKVKEGAMDIEDINEDLIEEHLTIGSSRPPIDLFIRTGGQLRIGMLLAWQVPHIELYFINAHAPDFGEEVFLDALRSFQQRDRMFGK